MGKEFLMKKFAFTFCVEAICKQTHGQTHRLVYVSLILIVYLLFSYIYTILVIKILHLINVSLSINAMI